MAELLHLSPEEATAVHLSLRVALWAMTASLIPGVLVALVLARGRFWGKALLDGVVHLPLVAGGDRLPATRPPRPARPVPRRAFRDRVRLSLDRCGTRLRGDGLSADGARSACRSRRSTAGWRMRLQVSAPGRCGSFW